MTRTTAHALRDGGARRRVAAALAAFAVAAAGALA
ncbi:hypothetical protein ATJ88_0553 [Isoptericola jiangsuensis]|uniref:Uncharacterized protein n=1 Tax=Isoptericola jiangsuensis TaxID=548579 RepID=A0A2A9ESC3_9MICO|nr:hypothetical protein ATJ88_0553 [Isoptericola jiangsuensis]